MIQWNFVRRQLRLNGQLIIFILCTLVSIVSIVALGGFGDSFESAVEKDARILNAADVIINSHKPISDELMTAINSDVGVIDKARIVEFYSMIRSNNHSLLVNVKAVDPGYPFYGEVDLLSGSLFNLQPHEAVAEKAVLDRLRAEVGDDLKLGNLNFTLTDVLIGEPDRPTGGFSLGPRLFITIEDAYQTGLIGNASRIDYDILIKTDEPDALVSRLRGFTDNERIRTYENRQNGVGRLIGNFLFFLQMVALFILILAGLGIQTTISSFLLERKDTVGILKVLGSKSKEIISNYLIVVLIAGSIGIGLGIGCGLLVQFFLPQLFEGVMPAGVNQIISFQSILEGLILGFGVVILFTILPLLRLKTIKPIIILHKQDLQAKRPVFATVVVLLLLAGLVFWQIAEIDIAAYFLLGILGLVGLSATIAKVLLTILKNTSPKRLMIRQAVRGLFRPRNSTLMIITTLSVSLAVIFTIFLVEANLENEFVTSFPEDAPNVFFLDLQADQVQDFKTRMNNNVQLFPIVVARIQAVNGKEVVSNQRGQGRPSSRGQRGERGESLSREFRLTYRDNLLENEQLIKGETLFAHKEGVVALSILDKVTENWGIDLGDEIDFSIQGVPLKAQVTSVRSSGAETFSPFFYWVFPEDVLIDAPQTIFATARVPAEEVPALQTSIVEQFPNLAIIDVTQTIGQVALLVNKLTRIIQFFNIFSILAGILILVSAILATQAARTQEAVFFKVLGAKNRFIKKVFASESLMIGLLSSILGIMIAQIGSWLIVTKLLKIPYDPFILSSLITIAILTLTVMLLGYLASISILKQKPITYLRKQSN